MMLFWIISAALMLVALVILAPALLRSGSSETSDRDSQNVVIARERLAELNTEKEQGNLTEEQFDKAKRELEQALLLDLDQTVDNTDMSTASGVGRLTLGAMVLLVPALTVGLYYHLGSPEMTRPTQERVAGAPHQGGEAMPSVEEMMAALMARLEENPEDSEGWFLLGRSYMALDNYAMASQAFERLHLLVGDDPVVLLSWADAQAMAQKGNLAGKPSELIRKAVKLAPEDTTALWLAGMVEDQSGNHQLAISYWERLEPKIKDDPESRQRIESLLASAREKAGSGEPAGPGSEPVAVSTAATATTGITVRVDLSPEFRGKVGPEESLFIYARALEGPRMPLAAARRKVSDLPLELTLDDSTAMMPAMRLSNFEQVLVGARVSRSGEAMARSGDLSGEVAPVRVGAAGTVEILIDKLLP
jgi:cytochrome c-type biogenesis protein CcmH